MHFFYLETDFSIDLYANEVEALEALAEVEGDYFYEKVEADIPTGTKQVVKFMAPTPGRHFAPADDLITVHW